MAEQNEIRLTPTEWHLLEMLVRNAGSSSPSVSYYNRCGDLRTAPRPTTFAYIWPTSAASWNPILLDRAI
jgi:hypothetical protein